MKPLHVSIQYISIDIDITESERKGILSVGFNCSASEDLYELSKFMRLTLRHYTFYRLS